MSDRGRDELAIEKKVYPPGSVLFEEGVVSSQIYLLLRGRMSIRSHDGEVRLIDREGSFVGEMNPLVRKPSTNTATAETECECVVIPVEYLEDTLKSNPDDEVGLLGVFATHLLKKTGNLPLPMEDFEQLAEQPEVEGARDARESRSGAGRGGHATEARGVRQILLVTTRQAYVENLGFHFKPMGFEVTLVTDPAELIDRMDDIQADLIIFSAADFPRHWKPVVKLLRERRSIEETVFVLITGDDFEFDEAAKAAYLQVNGIVPENLLEKKVLFQLTDLIRRYKTLDDHRKFGRVVPKETEIFRLLFTHPVRYFVVAGRVSDISLEGTSFIPDDPAHVADLKVDQKVPGCSLRAGEAVITVHCRVVRTGKDLGLEFESFDGDGHQRLFKYLMERPEREMRAQISRSRAGR